MVPIVWFQVSAFQVSAQALIAEADSMIEKEFVLADGKVVKRKIGTALVSINGTTIPSPVVLGKKNDSKLLGALTLESHGLALDPFERRIYKAKLFM